MNVTIGDDKTQAYVYVRTHNYMYSQQSNTLFSNLYSLPLYIYAYIHIYIHTCNSCNTGTSALPDIYAQARGHAESEGQCGCTVYQAKHKCMCYN